MTDNSESLAQAEDALANQTSTMLNPRALMTMPSVQGAIAIGTVLGGTLVVDAIHGAGVSATLSDLYYMSIVSGFGVGGAFVGTSAGALTHTAELALSWGFNGAKSAIGYLPGKTAQKIGSSAHVKTFGTNQMRNHMVFFGLAGLVGGGMLGYHEASNVQKFVGRTLDAVRGGTILEDFRKGEGVFKKADATTDDKAIQFTNGWSLGASRPVVAVTTAQAATAEAA